MNDIVEVKPYEPYSIRSIRMMEEMANFLNVDSICLREVRFLNYFTMDFFSFNELIHKNEDFRIKVRKKCQERQAELDPVEIQKKREEYNQILLEEDFSDLINYRLKSLIQVGDQWKCKETRTYTFSGTQYLTKGKRYNILSLDDRRDGLSDFSFVTDTDLETETCHNSVYSCHSIWRNDKEIWNWHQAFFDLWVEQNPNHPDTEKLAEYCKKQMQKD